VLLLPALLVAQLDPTALVPSTTDLSKVVVVVVRYLFSGGVAMTSKAASTRASHDGIGGSPLALVVVVGGGGGARDEESEVLKNNEVLLLLLPACSHVSVPPPLADNRVLPSAPAAAHLSCSMAADDAALVLFF
jgi:hypothetical protein